jgi:hypothetical protein
MTRVRRAASIAATLLLVAENAPAFSVSMQARGPTSSLVTSDTVTVDVFLATESGLTLFSVGVLASSDALLDYEPTASQVTPQAGSAGPGAQPSYILYTGGKGATILYPATTPAFGNWATPPPGQEQVNVNFSEPGLAQAAASGTGIWIATMVFRVTGPLQDETLSLSVTAGGNIVQFGGVVLPSSTVALSAPIQLVPEPGISWLVGSAILGICVLRLRGGRIRC